MTYGADKILLSKLIISSLSEARSLGYERINILIDITSSINNIPEVWDTKGCPNFGKMYMLYTLLFELVRHESLKGFKVTPYVLKYSMTFFYTILLNI